jgi:hypothetical protein
MLSLNKVPFFYCCPHSSSHGVCSSWGQQRYLEICKIAANMWNSLVDFPRRVVLQLGGWVETWCVTKCHRGPQSDGFFGIAFRNKGCHDTSQRKFIRAKIIEVRFIRSTVGQVERWGHLVRGQFFHNLRLILIGRLNGEWRDGRSV